MFSRYLEISSGVATLHKQKIMNVKTLLTAKIIVIQSVFAGFNLGPLITTCSQNTLPLASALACHLAQA